jgi:hypothetical protein
MNRSVLKGRYLNARKQLHHLSEAENLSFGLHHGVYKGISRRPDAKRCDDNPGTAEARFARSPRGPGRDAGEKVVIHAEFTTSSCARPGGEGPDKMISYEAADGDGCADRAKEYKRGYRRPLLAHHRHGRIIILPTASTRRKLLRGYFEQSDFDKSTPSAS